MKKKVMIFIITLLIIFGVIVFLDTKNENKIEFNNVNVINEVIEENNENNKIQNNEININESTVNEIDNKNKTQDQNVKIISTLSPSGFMGSSLKKVILYSNGEVYLVNYNGEGYNEENIVSKELIAQSADKIEYKGTEEFFEAIVVKGNRVKKINANYDWIQFEG